MSLAAAGSVLLAMAQGPVILRGAAEPDPRIVVSSSPAGLVVRGDREATIPWHVVKAATGADADLIEPYESLAADAWRATARAMRGDAAMAEPLLDRLAADLADASGPTPTSVRLCLAHARLTLGVPSRAIGPAILVFDAFRAGDEGRAPRDIELFAGLDLETGLWPRLPPLPRAGESIRSWEEELGPIIESGSASPEARGLAGIYLFAARSAAGIDPGPAPERGGAPMDFVRDVVMAWAAREADERSACRARLQGVIASQPDTWREAWARCALGRSLVREQDEPARKAGILHMLHLPARFNQVLPALALGAQIEAAEALRALGMQQGASILERSIAEHEADPGAFSSVFRRPAEDAEMVDPSIPEAVRTPGAEGEGVIP